MDAVTGRRKDDPALRPQEGVAQGSRANAIRHGLTATQHLPPELGPDAVQDIFEMLCRDTPPRSHFAGVALREVARHMAVLATIEGGELAVQRLAAGGLTSFVSPAPEMERDTALAAAVTAEPLRARHSISQCARTRTFFGDRPISAA